MRESVNNLLLLDPQDEHLRGSHKWVLTTAIGRNDTIVTYKSGKRVYLTRLIVGCKAKVDKINGNVFDYRRSNLKANPYHHNRKEIIRIRNRVKWQENRELLLNRAKTLRDTRNAADPGAARLRWKMNKAKQRLNINARIASRLRSLLSTALDRNQKQCSAVRDLGCTMDEFRSHLESRFYSREDGTRMSFENYGEWHLDHIKPLSSFDLSLPGEQSQAIHFTNIQPLWREDNLSKGKR